MMCFDDMTDDEKVSSLKRAIELLSFKRKREPTLAELMRPPFWVRINKKSAHNVKKSHKTERKVSR